MAHKEPSSTHLDARYSDPRAAAGDWADAVTRLTEAEIFWLSTVRPDGRPHVTPLLAVWQRDTLYFSSGERERKVLNLNENPEVVLTTGTNALDEGHDLVIEGEAVRERDDARLRELAALWECKYGPVWHFDVKDGAFGGAEGPALVFGVTPRTAFGFAKSPYGQTRWRFS
ncbi:pyridoxamine 5'-phosphate oxidase family protein [Streptomyces sp. IB2014 016-6]|uniref:pyridoxamine 5'-phosphate oxidase family protein n=1 Tax=Streptomyces sp. IB2014 016-6 TaxID=2517818 RepID=UPI0011CC6FFE|nr:pyridoxamine 5'-phosphate oxidase family protein [Streptomyces sp. IB2014 016-6]TXL92807.1 pyridoxamine 5'-phosphate oxidase family protein [Streptomyces sp. IB2014 016-6]